MKLASRRALDELLVSEEPCLGAVFCTYAFDPRFFEEQVLRSLLRMRSDPEEQVAMFHEEARRALQQTPVAVIVDASIRQAGRRLPYDQLLVRGRTFHPKLVLALYENEARVLVGSCNLTRGGYDENVELVFARAYLYDEPSDAESLRAIDAFLAASTALADAEGTQLALVREALARRLPSDATRPRGAPDHAIVHSLDRSMLDQLFDAIPEDAVLSRVGVLAPFYESDDAEAGSGEGIDSMLAALLERRRADGAIVDVATGWADAPVAADAGAVAPLEDNIGALWAWRWSKPTEDGPCDRVEYLIPIAITAKTVSYRDASGQGRRIDRGDVDEAIEERRLWPVRTPVLHLPSAIVASLRARFDVKLWMLPTTQLDERGRVQRRPLHAKLFLVSAKRRGKERTWVLVGSPNASRAAMLRPVAQGGNIELGVVMVFEGALSLPEILTSLVSCDPDRVELVEREMPEAEPDLGAWIRDAVHGAAARDLRIEWASEGPAPLGPWVLRYDGKDIAAGAGAPSHPTMVQPFDLSPVIAELELVTNERAYIVPIRVGDLAELPTTAALARLGLRELLALLGRRLGAERLESIAATYGSEGTDRLLESVFGEGFAPLDVFKAWWGVAEDLAQPISVPGFRHRLRGPMGVMLVWQRLCEEAGKGVAADDVWVYGCELARTLRTIALPDGPDQSAKRALLDALISEIGTSLDALRPPSDGRPWLDAVASFYAEGSL